MSRSQRTLMLVAALSLLAAACDSGDTTTTAGDLAPVTTASSSDTQAVVPPSTTVPITQQPTTTTTEPPFYGGIDLTGEYSIVDPETGTEVTVTFEDGFRRIVANGLPDHDTGEFPNAGNPNEISAQMYDYRFPLDPEQAPEPVPYNIPQPFGVAINGVVMDPFAAEWWERDPNSGWQYEALGGGIELGLDDYNAHVQPTGAYHYHGIPVGIIGDLDATEHSPLLGWAGDGFPVYALYGYIDPDDPDSEVLELFSSYTIRSGTRPSGPGGAYDGSFVEDYEYVEDLGDLDACNGRFGVTPDFPEGTYHYVLTTDFPVIPRCFAGSIAADFVLRGPGG